MIQYGGDDGSEYGRVCVCPFPQCFKLVNTRYNGVTKRIMMGMMVVSRGASCWCCKDGMVGEGVYKGR